MLERLGRRQSQRVKRRGRAALHAPADFALRRAARVLRRAEAEILHDPDRPKFRAVIVRIPSRLAVEVLGLEERLGDRECRDRGEDPRNNGLWPSKPWGEDGQRPSFLGWACTAG